jgi:hypothetical protein
VTRLQMDEVIANSFMDYHVKGFSYLCLRRSDRFTDKLYFFEGDVSKAAEVVSPHNHRYGFKTTCLVGSVENRWYTLKCPNFRPPQWRTYQEFDYLTPLNGGDGFTWKREILLYDHSSLEITARGFYGMRAREIHTIQIKRPETIIRLSQYEDVVPVGVPTQTWCLDREPPSLSGLYRKPKPDEVVQLIAQARSFDPSIPEVV